jgi:Lar family restriction alleviation protein
MNDELKPCPFCGSDKIRESKDFKITKNEELRIITTCVKCTYCGCNGPTIAYVEDTILAWNKR